MRISKVIEAFEVLKWMTPNQRLFLDILLRKQVAI